MFAAIVLVTSAATSLLRGPQATNIVTTPSAIVATSAAAATSPVASATTAAAPVALVAVAAQPTPRGAIPSGYRITIARLGIDLALAEGDLKRDTVDQRTPEGFAFHLPGTAFPGDGGNTYLYAHARRGMFLTLWDARAGDTITVSEPDGGALHYIVRDLFPRVPPSDVSSTWPTTMERLTLQTSTGPSPTDPRFVLFAFPSGQ